MTAAPDRELRRPVRQLVSPHLSPKAPHPAFPRLSALPPEFRRPVRPQRLRTRSRTRDRRREAPDILQQGPGSRWSARNPSRPAARPRFLRLCDGPGQAPPASAPPRPPRMRSGSEPPFPGRHPTAYCGELPSRRRVRRTGLEGPGKLLLLVSSPSLNRPCSRTARTPASDRWRVGTGSAQGFPPFPFPSLLSLDRFLILRTMLFAVRMFQTQPHGRSGCWSDERDEHADLARGPRGAPEGSGCRNGRRHAGHGHGKRGGGVERAQEPQLAVRDRIQGLHAGFDVVLDAGAGGRPNFAVAEAAACSSVDQLMRCAYTWMADSSPPPDLPLAPFSIRWRSIARASSSEGALAWIRAASFLWTPCRRNDRRPGSNVTPAYHPCPAEQPPFRSMCFSNSATRPACASVGIPLPVMGRCDRTLPRRCPAPGAESGLTSCRRGAWAEGSGSAVIRSGSPVLLDRRLRNGAGRSARRRP